MFVHNLNHVSAFLYPCLSCFGLACLTKPYSSLPCTTHGLLTFQHTRFCLFHFLFFAPIVLFFFLVLETEKKLSPSPRSLVTLHFFTLYPTLHLPDFLQPACFSACLLLFVCEPLSLRNCPCQFVRVIWTEGILCSVCYSSKREGRQVSKHKALSTIHGSFRVPWPNPFPFPVYPPPLSPLWSRP